MAGWDAETSSRGRVAARQRGGRHQAWSHRRGELQLYPRCIGRGVTVDAGGGRGHSVRMSYAVDMARHCKEKGGNKRSLIADVCTLQ